MKGFLRIEGKNAIAFLNKFTNKKNSFVFFLFVNAKTASSNILMFSMKSKTFIS